MICSPSAPQKCTGHSLEPFPSCSLVTEEEEVLLNRQLSLGVSKELREY